MGADEKRPVLDPADGDDLLGGIAGRFGFRQRLRRRPGLNVAYRMSVGVLGAVVLAAGILMIPYPGPGWLVVFAGLAILATEFPWAERVLRFARRRYDAWVRWVKRQHILVRLLVLAMTGLVVLVTLWLLNVYGLIAGLIGIEIDWLASPIPFLRS